MLFSSISFLFFFFPVFLFLYYALPWKNGVLLAASLLFYAWGEPRFVPLLLASAALNYGFGRAIAGDRGRAGIWLKLGVAANLAMLAWFKYIGFLGRAVNDLFGSQLSVPEVVLPLGISFFTFQGISYLVDVYYGRVPAQRSFLRFATYKAMFPQLIAGPIVRYRHIAADIGQRVVDSGRLLAGFEQFAIGLAQKVLIANTLALPADRLFGAGFGELSTLSAWLGLLCYTLQIYYDFCGYSNMALGMGKMLGFDFPVNFDRPYSARSATEFWQRWHMSLSSWFRDYLYIPLGGNRGGPLLTYFNLAAVFLLCGLWHGAAWTFVVWGFWHGSWLIVERMGLRAMLGRLPPFLAQAWAFGVVMLGWVWFRAPDLPAAMGYMGNLFHWNPSAHARPWQYEIGSVEIAAIAAGLLFALLPTGRAPGEPATAVTGHWARYPVAAAGIAVSACALAGGTYNPFLYYRF